MTNLPSLPAHFWTVVALCALALALLWWVALGARRLARRRVLRDRIEVLRQGSTLPEPSELATMQQAIADALRSLQERPPAAAVRDALYDIPWFLFIGDAEADVAGLLAAARSPRRPPPEPPDEAFWRWHLLPAMTAIEIHPTALCEADDHHRRSLWFEALLELAEERERLPLNGIVICVSACAVLAAGGLEREPGTARLRRLVDEAAGHLRLHLPVYLVVTGLERLEGYQTVHRALPAEVLAQAVGLRVPPGEAPGAPAGSMLDALLEQVDLRLHALRMGLLRGLPGAAQRRDVHVFIERLRALRPGLRVLVERSFRDAHGAPPPRWRGLYLTAARPAGGDAAFVTDLFDRLLPRDQPLARP